MDSKAQKISKNIMSQQMLKKAFGLVQQSEQQQTEESVKEESKLDSLLKAAEVILGRSLTVEERLLKIVKAGVSDKELFALDELEKINISLKSLIEKDNSMGKVEITNFPKEKEIKPPVVNIPAPVVKVEAPIINIDTKKLEKDTTSIDGTLKEISVKLNRNDKGEIEKVTLVDKDGKPVDLSKLKNDHVYRSSVGFEVVGVKKVDETRINPATEEGTKGSAPLSGASTNGQVVLTNANTWYAVPSTAPTSAYVLVATPETSVGTIRWAFANTGTPSTTNGNFVIGHFTVKLAANQVVYFGSSSGLDSVNFTTKII